MINMQSLSMMIERTVVDGYVRGIGKYLMRNTIIPMDIYHICFDFYFTSKFVFYLSLTTVDHEPVMNVFNNKTKQAWNCKLRQLSNTNKEITESQWSIESAGITFARNIPLPHKVSSTLRDKFVKNRALQFNNVIFKCGGVSYKKVQNNCGALIVNSHDYQQTNMNVFMWDLPKLPQKLAGNYCLYSHKDKILYSIGGANEQYPIDEIYTLSLNSETDETYITQDMDRWKWSKFYSKLHEPKHGVSATLLDNDKKLMIAGGRSFSNEYLNTVELYDFEKDEWSRDIPLIPCMNHKRIRSGIYYDNINKKCYVGGGSDGTKSYGILTKHTSFQSVECYDFEKNAWKLLPRTQLQHDMNPTIWIKDGHILYIMSVKANGIEFMDLRQTKWHSRSGSGHRGNSPKTWTKWNIQTDDLQTSFNTKFDTHNVTWNRIVGN